MYPRSLLLPLLFIGIVLAQAKKQKTLILNVLVKDEANILDKTLPKWAPLVDFWIVGIDLHNTDNSAEVVRKHLGHLPGEIMTVEFDGMGPTITKLVKRGLEKFPEATHGILSDADFSPLQGSLDKSKLCDDCSKMRFKVRDPDGERIKILDWIYQNIPGVYVMRRTHQTLEVPRIPGQKAYITDIDLLLQEHGDGFQARSGKKFHRYLEWLEKDDIDMPNDPRTIQYLGVAHMDLIDIELGDFAYEAVKNNHPKAKHVYEAIRYFKMRANMTEGMSEERWFAWILAGKICNRGLKDMKCSLEMWNKASEFDPERVESWLYLGNIFRDHKQYNLAFYNLKKALSLEIPDRSLHLHEYLYTCTRHVDFAKTVSEDPGSTRDDWLLAKFALQVSKTACKGREKTSWDGLYPQTLTKLKDENLPKSRMKKSQEVSGEAAAVEVASQDSEGQKKKKKKKPKDQVDGEPKKKKERKGKKAAKAKAKAGKTRKSKQSSEL